MEEEGKGGERERGRGREKERRKGRKGVEGKKRRKRGKRTEKGGRLYGKQKTAYESTASLVGSERWRRDRRGDLDIATGWGLDRRLDRR